LGLSGDRLVLYSPSHRKEVIPLLTSALAFSQTLGISQFFGALVKQNTRNWLGWSWGKLGDEPFLPRVSRGRIVLVRATWRVQKSEVESIVKQRDAERFRGIQRWRHERRLPRLCLLIDNDNELLLDLDNILSIDTFCDLVRNRPYFVLQENFPGSDELAARGPDGGYTNEIVVPLLRRTLPANRNRDDIPAPRPPSTAKQPPDVLAPGSDWLYFKLYCGEGTADAILTRTLAPAISQWRSQGVIDSWFFIRYSDPDSHLRVRLHGNASALGGVALREMHRVLDPFLQNAQLWRIELGTYEREIGRYGGPLNIERAERLFELDSEAALEIVRACSADAGAVWRWQLALAGSDRWLRDFGLDLAGRRAFARSARDGYIKEFGASNKATQGWLAERFRKERKAITPLISLTHEPSSPAVAVGLEALATRSRLAAPLIREMHDLNSCGELSCPIAPILHSLIHMFCNRVLRSSQRLQEMVLYEFLARLYDSELARCEQRDRLPVHG
jgi:thiopeptide-type bacteriocin biosynthesis protein